MKVALVVHRVLTDASATMAGMLRMASEAADAGAGLVVFGEAALTGLAKSDNPARDLALGQPIPGPVTGWLSALARERGVWLGAGLLEREGNRLYDSAVLLGPEGGIALKYRRIHPGWHGPEADPTVYNHGSQLNTVDTPLGRFAFLICGDLFDDGLVRRVGAHAPDWLLFPFARSFDDGSCSQERWEREEVPVYVERVRLAGVTTLMANYLGDRGLDDDSFGGAMVVSAQGQVLASYPLGRAGMLLADLSDLAGG
jgi:N-carbamoylputrescine amidase